jgi:hypothetical protein
MSDKNTQIVTKNLQYRFSDEELAEIADGLVKELDEISVAEFKRKNLAAEMKADIDKKKELADDLRRKYRNRYEYRDVDCEVTYDYDRRVVVTMRTDTGEIIDERGMTAEELQLDFDTTTHSESEEPAEEQANESNHVYDSSEDDDDGDDDAEVDIDTGLTDAPEMFRAADDSDTGGDDSDGDNDAPRRLFN